MSASFSWPAPSSYVFTLCGSAFTAYVSYFPCAVENVNWLGSIIFRERAIRDPFATLCLFCNTRGVAALKYPFRLIWITDPVAIRIGGGKTTFDGEYISEMVVDSNGTTVCARSRYSFEFQCHPEDVANVLIRHPDCVSVRIPLGMIYERLTREELIKLARLHGLWVPSRLNAAACRHVFVGHECVACVGIMSIFKCVQYIADDPITETAAVPGSRPRKGRPRRFISTARSKK